MLVDITDLEAVERRQRLLFDELNHRVKNTLAIVQSLAQHTQRSNPDPQEFTRAFGDGSCRCHAPTSSFPDRLARRAARQRS